MVSSEQSTSFPMIAVSPAQLGVIMTNKWYFVLLSRFISQQDTEIKYSKSTFASYCKQESISKEAR